jgi:Rieske Fe-S protein
MDEKLSPPSEEEQNQTLAQEHVSRRTLLMNLGIALNAVVAAAIATPVIAYLLGPVLRRKEYLEWVAIGNVSDFPPGETKLINYANPFSEPWDGASAKVPAYVRCSAPGEFIVFAINCAHLGCPVRWFAESQLFMCPCHGGVYYADGSRASGPPERGLFTYELKVQDGKLLINAGQLPTLQNRAGAKPCPSLVSPSESKLVSRIDSCPPQGPPKTGSGTSASTIG